MSRRTLSLVAIALAAATAPAAAIPAFARKYRTSCTTCHTAAPKLNVFGEAFRLNGYRMPDNEQLLRREEPVPLGEEPWRDLWPRSIWPGELPGALPFALRVQLDAYIARQAAGGTRASYRFPHEVYLLGGGSLGDNVAAFLEAEWSHDEGLEIAQARLTFLDVLPWLPARALNLAVGFQNLYLFTFADRQIDRASRQGFHWQSYAPAEVTPGNAAGARLTPRNAQPVAEPQAALVATGLLGPRFAYGVGLAQGNSEGTEDNNAHKDLYYTVRWKVGGLGLDGRYATGRGPVLGGHGQLLDRALILEHFGYFGAEPAAGGRSDAYRVFGFAARALAGPADVGAGFVWRRDARPWGADAAGALTQRSAFAKAEYLAFPWLIGSLKLERFTVDLPQAVRDSGYTRGRFDETRVIPGVVVLVRQNVRVVAEADLFARHAPSTEAGVHRPAALWLRLDVSY